MYEDNKDEILTINQCAQLLKVSPWIPQSQAESQSLRSLKFQTLKYKNCLASAHLSLISFLLLLGPLILIIVEWWVIPSLIAEHTKKEEED